MIPQVDLVETFLLDHGANPNIVTAAGLTPLVAAGYDTRGDCIDKLPFIPHGADGEAAARLLLSRGANPKLILSDYRVPTPSGADARHTARYANVNSLLLAGALDKPAMVAMILDSKKFDIQSRRNEGETNVMAAVRPSPARPGQPAANG